MAPLRCAVLCALFIVACQKTPRTAEERGQHAFLRLCSGCHGDDARGTQRPGFKVPPRDLTDPALHARLGEQGIRKTIINGKGQMPPFGPLLPPEEIDDLVRYVWALKRAP